jgi:hypothetical protein
MPPMLCDADAARRRHRARDAIIADTPRSAAMMLMLTADYFRCFDTPCYFFFFQFSPPLLSFSLITLFFIDFHAAAISSSPAAAKEDSRRWFSLHFTMLAFAIFIFATPYFHTLSLHFSLLSPPYSSRHFICRHADSSTRGAAAYAQPLMLAAEAMSAAICFSALFAALTFMRAMMPMRYMILCCLSTLLRQKNIFRFFR